MRVWRVINAPSASGPISSGATAATAAEASDSTVKGTLRDSSGRPEER